jgi:hypothetical protein
MCYVEQEVDRNWRNRKRRRRPFLVDHQCVHVLVSMLTKLLEAEAKSALLFANSDVPT